MSMLHVVIKDNNMERLRLGECQDQLTAKWRKAAHWPPTTTATSTTDSTTPTTGATTTVASATAGTEPAAGHDLTSPHPSCAMTSEFQNSWRGPGNYKTGCETCQTLGSRQVKNLASGQDKTGSTTTKTETCTTTTSTTTSTTRPTTCTGPGCGS